MHGFDATARTGARPVVRAMNRYHWFVLAVAAMGWLFDTMDQQLFVLRGPRRWKTSFPPCTVRRKRHKTLDMDRRRAGDNATSIFMTGWATGGLVFGVLGDRIGRANTMIITILLYSLFTGLSSFSHSSGTSLFIGSSRGWASGANLPSAWPWWPKSCRDGPAAMRWRSCRLCPASAT